jgi:hypothetical protein
MKFVKLNTERQPQEWPVDFNRIRFDNPSVSFPKSPVNRDFSSYNFEPFQYSTKPEFDQDTQNIEEISPVLSDGVWVQTWNVTEKYSESEKAEKIAERDSINLEMRSAQERFDRDALLLETDWVVIKALENSESVDADMTAYRQALRDVPSQSGFPDAIVWPTKPTE